MRIAEVFFQEMVRRFEVPKMTSMLRPPGVPDPADGRLFVQGPNLSISLHLLQHPDHAIHSAGAK